MSVAEKELEEWAKTFMPVYHFMDITVDSVTDGLYRCTVPLNTNTGNHINTVHAAFQWAAVEMFGGLVVLTKRSREDYVPVVRNLEIEFLQPAFTDISSEAFFSDRDVEKMNLAMKNYGRYDFELSSTIKNTDCEIVAKAKGTYAIRILE
jgi:acyl-coenzyme A thioesterase PaaI-like protein